MWNWILILLVPIAILLLIEELSQFIWRSYLKDGKEKKNTRIHRIMERARQTMKKYKKNPSL
ncbi:hypothetical protein M3204_10745 [Mesobacillus subterraneus]|jgi:C4-dicarboxylate-specific signal transduction histidine kinase|uniref:hypothetical protein n=1 Tax=Mesobacillus subterraneus TaxID=285983 RepID=UPI00203E2F37|nr:hypothetical protein [Mesobacillus subterraneus]MCM3664885.1 hypothetical protein [Mesobacillus subterraneus]MCM3681973.1 hypothetical protein [Mesobacillus subterraneus]